MWLGRHITDEGLVNLQIVGWEPLQVVQARVTHTEIINRDVNAHLFQNVQSFNGRIGIAHDRAFGQLQIEIVWIKPRLFKYPGDHSRQAGLPEHSCREV